MLAKRSKLPAYEMREYIVRTVKNAQVVVVSGETGCGKTTQARREEKRREEKKMALGERSLCQGRAVVVVVVVGSFDLGCWSCGGYEAVASRELAGSAACETLAYYPEGPWPWSQHYFVVHLIR